MAFKYAAEVPRCAAPCNCMEEHEGRSVTVFRIMAASSTESHFLPNLKQGASPSPHPHCSELALSFWSTLPKARRKVHDMAKRGADVRARFGQDICIGEIALGPTDGDLSKKPNKSGHLNLYQDANARFAHRILTRHDHESPQAAE